MTVDKMKIVNRLQGEFTMNEIFYRKSREEH